jgi:hypothetical protein
MPASNDSSMERRFSAARIHNPVALLISLDEVSHLSRASVAGTCFFLCFPVPHGNMLKSHFQAIRCADKVTFVLYSPLTVLSF